MKLVCLNAYFNVDSFKSMYQTFFLMLQTFNLFPSLVAIILSGRLVHDNSVSISSIAKMCSSLLICLLLAAILASWDN